MTGSDTQRLLIGSSVKMHLTAIEARTWLTDCRDAFAVVDDVELFLLPPFVCLPMAAEILRGSEVAYGAQNMHWHDRGPYTGEISPLMLVELGASLVEIGHAERRRYFGETDETVNLKVLAALRHGLTPIICIGESARDASAADRVLRHQLAGALEGVAGADLESVVIAYEPVWAIGQTEAADPEYVFDRHQAIRTELTRLYGDTGGRVPRLIYGGSVAPDNAGRLVAHPEVQGLFIGRAALQPSSFLSIVREASAAR
jgi:triosephosphate isomerase